jgi:superfamily I DNA/RNA helicase
MENLLLRRPDDVVFVIGAADGQFPTRRSIEADDIEEERCLFYVAVARAKNELYICYPKVASLRVSRWHDGERVPVG